MNWNHNMRDKKIAPAQTGINMMLDQALQAYEKLPMLQVICDRLTRLLSTTLRHFTAENVEVEIGSFKSSRFINFANLVPHHTITAVFRANEWDGLGMLIFENGLVNNLIDSLLGGKKAVTTTRMYTPIEQGIVKQVTQLFLHELQKACEQIGTINFSFDHLETNINATNIARPNDAVILLQLKILINGRSNIATLVLPHATIEPIKDKLQQVYISDKVIQDNSWSEELLACLYNIEMPLVAVISDNKKSFQEVINLQVGHTLVLNYKEDDHIDITCEHHVLFKGKIGKVQDKIAVNITQVNHR